MKRAKKWLAYGFFCTVLVGELPFFFTYYPRASKAVFLGLLGGGVLYLCAIFKQRRARRHARASHAVMGQSPGFAIAE
jgi:cyanate permease